MKSPTIIMIESVACVLPLAVIVLLLSSILVWAGPTKIRTPYSALSGPNTPVTTANASSDGVGAPLEVKQYGSTKLLNDKASSAEHDRTLLSILGFLVNLVVAMAALVSARASVRSAAFAERTVRAAFTYSVVPLTSRLVARFQAAHGIPQGWTGTIELHNSGNQTVRLERPTLAGQPEGVVKLRDMECHLRLQSCEYSVSGPTINVFADATAKVTLRFIIGESFETDRCFDGMLRFAVRPTLDDGTKSIEVPCKFLVQ